MFVCLFVCLLCRRRPAGVREREVFVCVFVYDAPKRTNSSAACSFASVTNMFVNSFTNSVCVCALRHRPLRRHPVLLLPNLRHRRRLFPQNLWTNHRLAATLTRTRAAATEKVVVAAAEAAVAAAVAALAGEITKRGGNIDMATGKGPRIPAASALPSVETRKGAPRKHRCIDTPVRCTGARGRQIRIANGER